MALRWALELTKPARDQIEREQTAAMQAGKEAGKTTREIAREVGVSHSTVIRRFAGAEEKGSILHQPGAPSPLEPASQPEPGASDGPKNWWPHVYRVLGEVLQLPGDDAILAHDYRGTHLAIGLELDRAAERLNLSRNASVRGSAKIKRPATRRAGRREPFIEGRRQWLVSVGYWVLGTRLDGLLGRTQNRS